MNHFYPTENPVLKGNFDLILFRQVRFPPVNLRLFGGIFVSRQFSTANSTKFYLAHLTFLLTQKVGVTAVMRC